uniref:ABC transporter permease n=1 Tax=Velocimicrobium porci TaxID=2606634 RepID=UPI0012B20CB2
MLNNKEFEIAGLLKYDPFSENGLVNGKITLITTSDTFVSLTDIEDYSIIMAQVADDITDEEISLISGLVGTNCTFEDKRDQQTTGIYTAFIFCVYGFLAIIILVTVLNIINSISMSVSAKIKQYGAMRAVGMNEHQITKMIVAEAFTYAIIGAIVGCTIGLLISRWLYTTLISSHFSYATWTVPFIPLLGIIIFILCTVALASYAPSKRIRNISVTETINKM